MSGFDIIGDIHGEGEKLKKLLDLLHYQHGTHPDGRQAIFLGDLIDRGPDNAMVLDIVRTMEAKGTARIILANHEFNAVAYARPKGKTYIRPHTMENAREHATFLAEFPFGSDGHKEVLNWFSSLPLYIKEKDFNVVHACWNEAALGICKPYLRKKDHSLVPAAYTLYGMGKRQPVHKALETLIKGPTYDLPSGITFLDTSLRERSRSRIYWWQDPDALPETLADKAVQFAQKLSDKDVRRLRNLRDKFNYASKRPVFVGHYNMTLAPYLTSPMAACLNFKGHVVAYRHYHGERTLSPEHLVVV